MPGTRKTTSSENALHHTVVLGDTYDLEISRFPNPDKLSKWWRGRSTPDAMRFYLHVVRETDILEVTVAVSLLLLSEVYSTHMSKPPRSDGLGPDEPKWEPRPCYRLEYGHSPVSDFGICKGRIQGKTNRVQTWTYYHPKTSTRTTLLDPDNHYWLYFRTIKGEEIVLDCCSAAYGMGTCVDASGCIKNLPDMFRDYGSARTPACFHTISDQEDQSHVLIEEKRFSVMQNTLLHGALGWEIFGGRKLDQHVRVREFIKEVQGKPCTPAQEERVQDFRSHGALMLNQVLSGRYWKEWEKPTVYSRDECFDMGNYKRDVFAKGSREDPECTGKLNGLLGLFGEAFGIN